MRRRRRESTPPAFSMPDPGQYVVVSRLDSDADVCVQIVRERGLPQVLYMLEGERGELRELLRWSTGGVFEDQTGTRWRLDLRERP